MGVPLPTREQRRAVVLARWRLRNSLLKTFDGIDIGLLCQCDYCVKQALASGELSADKWNAKLELRKIVDDIIHNKKGHYLAHSHDEANAVSYARCKSMKFLPERRTKTTLGRYIRRQYPDVVIKEEFLEQFVAKVMADLMPVDSKFKMISGPYIKQAYQDEIGGESCMTGDDSNKVKIYAINPDVVSMLVYDDGEMTGRCLVWKTDQGHTVTDRIYPNSGRHIAEYEKYISEQGWHRRSDNRAPSCSQYIVGLEHERLSVTLKVPDPPIWPYIDTFAYYGSRDIDYDNNKITLKMNGDYSLHSTSGEGPDCERVECSSCGTGLDEEDALYSPGGDAYCESCFSENYTYCNRCGETVDSDDTHEVHVDYSSEEWCEYCTNNHAIHCERCSQYVRNTCTTTVDGDAVCDSCAEESSECADCGGRFWNDDMEEVGGESYCCSCGANQRAILEEESNDENERSGTDQDTEPSAREVAAVA